MKSKKIQLLIKILIPVVILGACIGAEKIFSMQNEKAFNKVVVVNNDESLDFSNNSGVEVISKESYGDVEGLSRNLGFINDDEVLLALGLNRKEFYEKYPDEIDKENYELEDALINDLCGRMYVYNLKDFSKRPLEVDEREVCSDLIAGDNKYAYLNGDRISIADLNTKLEIGNIDTEVFGENYSSQNIGSDLMGMWSKDGKCLISYDFENLIIYNVEENSLKKVKVDKGDGLHVSVMPSYYSEDGKDIYFIGVEYKKNNRCESIVKVNSETGSIEKVLSLPYDNVDSAGKNYMLDNNYSVLSGGEQIIFNAIIEGINGTYIYDVEDNKFYNVVPHTVEGEYGSYTSEIWVSPDKNKIIYKNLAEEDGKKQWNLYAARINGNSLTDRVCIYKDINLCGQGLTWSSDSRKILFFTADEDIVKNNIPFKNKNEINIITFK